MPLNPTRKLDLSPRAASMLLLPIQAKGYELLDAGGAFIASVDHFGDNALDAGFAAFIAALVNEALTPAAPVVTIIPEDNAELRQLITTEWEAAEQPVRMCAVTDCLNAADPAQQQRTADSLWGREDEPEQPATEQAPAAPQSQAQQAWAAAVVDAVALGIAVPNMDPAADDADVAKAAGKLRKQIDAARKTAQPA